MTLQQYFAQYEASHQHPGNRLCHGFGIPLIIAAGLYLVFIDLHPLAWLLFAVGWGLQFIGHALEGSWPEFMSNPLFLFVGPLYFANKLIKKVRRNKLK